MIDSPHLSPDDQQRLYDLAARFQSVRKTNIGYPCNQDFDYSELAPFFAWSANNIGDPFGPSNYRLNTLEFERDVLVEFARLEQAEDGQWWGYVTSGGTEGNMYGLYVAREMFPDGICYFSEDTHYSVAKVLRLQHTRSIMLKSQANGEIDYTDLRETLRIHRDAPPIIFANIGTTMKGAIDNIATIRGILEDLAITAAYIHADAALSGMILPFVAEPQPWNFAAGADSISISGHKLLGSPLPCGVVLARKKNVDRIARSIEYIGALDTTISGSRSAIGPLFLWYRLRTLGRDGITAMVRGSLECAAYAVDALKAHGIDAWRNENSVTVVFPRPPEAVMKKWIIAPKRGIGHLITMPHVKKDIVDEFAADFAAAIAAEKKSSSP